MTAKKLLKYLKRSATAFTLAFTTLVLLAALTPIANILARPLVVDGASGKADVIVVLGGGAYGNGSLGGASNERLIRALVLLNEGRAPKVLFSGGSILRLTRKLYNTTSDAGGPLDVVEARVMRDLAVSMGVEEGALAVDEGSSNTYENLRGAAAFMRRENLGTCLIVTSPLHMRRAMGVAERLGLECAPAPVEDYTPYRTSALERVHLMRDAAWEYLALVLYRLYGYI